MLSGEIEHLDPIAASANVGDEQTVAANEPLLNSRIALRDDVNPFRRTITLQAQLDNAKIRSVAICQQENAIIRQHRNKRISDIPQDTFGRTWLVEVLNIEARAPLLSESAHDESDSFRVSEQAQPEFRIFCEAKDLCVLTRIRSDDVAASGAA